MKGKKGIIDKIIVSFPVLIFIIVLLGAYLFLSAGSSILKNPEKEVVQNSTLPTKDLMLESATFKLADGTTKRLLVFDAINFYLNDQNSPEDKKVSLQDLTESLEKLKKDGDCYLISISAAERTPNSLIASRVNLGEEKFWDAEYQKRIKYFKENRFQTEYYYGGCP